jgi:hypothetical protein
MGVIPARNIFVATGVAPRNRLGDKGSAAWNAFASAGVTAAHLWFGGAVLGWKKTRAFGLGDEGVVCDVF